MILVEYFRPMVSYIDKIEKCISIHRTFNILHIHTMELPSISLSVLMVNRLHYQQKVVTICYIVWDYLKRICCYET